METKRYLLACLGGFVGGLIASLPWLTLYTMGGLIVAVLAFLIAPGVNYGYRKLKGRVNRKLPTTIIVISVIVLVVIDLLILPAYFSKTLNLNIIFNLVFTKAYWQIMLRELIISTVFAVAGIFKVVNDIKYEIGINY